MPEWLLSIVVSFVIGGGVVYHLLTRIRHLEAQIAQFQTERDELITGRARSTMYAESLIDANERREKDLAELREVHYSMKQDLWRTKESYDRFVTTMRVAIKNAQCDVDVDRLKNDCELVVYAQQLEMMRHGS